MDKATKALVVTMGEALTDTQAHMMAIEVILATLLRDKKIDRAPIIALFHAMRESAPPEIAVRAEVVLYGLLGLDRPTSGFH